MAEAHCPTPKLASRRPDWELPELHSGLLLAPLDVLHDNKQRIKCPKCGRSRAHYCYDCLQPLVPFPRVDLPFRVSIVTHHEEKASKNTGVQVAILAAGQVDLHSMSQVPTDVDPSRCAVLFPSDNALEVEQLEPDSIDRLFIIDSRWKKAGELVRTETFRAMRAVKLSETRSAFWRFHTRGVAEEGVCTVEALYFFLDALAKQGKLSDPRFTAPHAFDNLLWYFVYQHQVVQHACQKRLQERGAAAQGQGQGQGAAAQEKGEGQERRQQQQQQQKGQKQQHGKGQQQQQKGQKQQKQKQREEQQKGASDAAEAAPPPPPQQQQHADTDAEGAAGGPPAPAAAAECGQQRAPDNAHCGGAEAAGQQQQPQLVPEHDAAAVGAEGVASVAGSGRRPAPADGPPGGGGGASGADGAAESSADGAPGGGTGLQQAGQGPGRCGDAGDCVEDGGDDAGHKAKRARTLEGPVA